MPSNTLQSIKDDIDTAFTKYKHAPHIDLKQREIDDTMLTKVLAYIRQKSKKLTQERIDEIQRMPESDKRIPIITPPQTQKHSRSRSISKNERIKLLQESIRCSLYSLDLSNNKITRLTPEMFRGFHINYHLDLSNNDICTLEDHTFEGLEVYNSLLLNNNQIKNISPHTFSGVLLCGLNLTQNLIKFIDKTTLPSIPSDENGGYGLFLDDDTTTEPYCGLGSGLIETQHRKRKAEHPPSPFKTAHENTKRTKGIESEPTVAASNT